MSGNPILFYDGTCGFCSATVRFVLRRDRARVLRFAPLQGKLARQLISKHPELERVDSIIWVESSGTQCPKILAYSDAALQVARYLGGIWRIASIFRVIPRRLRDAVYRRVAANRHIILGADEQCLVPTSEERKRFILEQ